MASYSESGSPAEKVGMNCCRVDIDHRSPVVPAWKASSNSIREIAATDMNSNPVSGLAFGKRKEPVMAAAHTASFLQLISAQLEETSRGEPSPHHLHNVRCGIENILSLLELNNEIIEKADQLARRASDYITRHDLISFKIRDETISEDTDRLRATYEALASFSSAVEHSQPNSRLRTLGLA